MNAGKQIYQQRRYSFIRSLGFAMKGIIKAFVYENNFKIHVAAGFAAGMLGHWLRLSLLEWAILIICIGAVIAFELVNTVVELVCNRISTDHHPLTGLIKDLSAAAVLVVSITSAIIGLLLFVPKLLDKIYGTL